ncbi:MAG: hypothetical protein ACI4EN_02975 [Butyrivibrio sp.]
MKNKKAVRILVCIISLVIVTGIAFTIYITRPYKLNNIEFTEFCMIPSEKYYDECNMEKMLQMSYISTTEGTGFQNANISKNKYIMESVYYNFKIINSLNIDTDDYKIILNMLINNAGDEINNMDITAIDAVAYICINSILGIDCKAETDSFIKKHYDDNSKLLFQESLDEDIEYKVSFTAEVINLFNENNVEFDSSMFEDGIQNYYLNTKFKLPGEGDTLFNSGGMAIYAMNLIGKEFVKTLHNEWFEEWSDYYSPFTVNNWDDLLYIVSSYIPVAQAFDSDITQIDNNIKEFLNKPEISENIVDEEFNEHMMYSLVGSHLNEYNNEIQNEIYAVCCEQLELYFNRLCEISLEECFYGSQIAYILNYEYDKKAMYETCDKIYADKIKVFKDDSKNSNLEEFINDTYYYLMMRNLVDYNELIDTPAVSDKEIYSVLKICMKMFPDSQVKDPAVLRKLCECLSNTKAEATQSFRKYVEKYLSEYMSDEAMLNTYYVSELFIIDKIFGTEIVDKKIVKNTINKLCKNNCCTETTKENDRYSLDATYMIRVTESRFVELLKPDNNVESEIFLNEDNLYTYYPGEGGTDLKSNFYGLCLRVVFE